MFNIQNLSKINKVFGLKNQVFYYTTNDAEKDVINSLYLRPYHMNIKIGDEFIFTFVNDKNNKAIARVHAIVSYKDEKDSTKFEFTILSRNGFEKNKENKENKEGK